MTRDRERFAQLAQIAGPTLERAPFTFACAARVGFSDTDAQSIVYYGRYAPYFDMARVEYMRYLGLSAGRPDPVHTGEFAMRHFEIDYHAPAQFDDQLEVFCRVAKLGNSSLTFEYAVYKIGEHEDQQLAASTQVMVYVDLAARRPVRIPDALRATIDQFEHGSETPQ